MNQLIRVRSLILLIVFVLTPGLIGCDSSDDNDSSADAVTGEGLFADGCPVAGFSSASEIVDDQVKMDGPDAIGTVGDYLLMNEKSAFIIESPDNINAYYLYGGIVVDAVALADCAQACPEQFEEIGFFFGQLNIADYTSSVLRSFRGDSVEILNDGRNGEDAVVRVYGEDDYFWLIELELLKERFRAGDVPSLSDPFGIEIYVDYILPPDSSVLTIEINFVNKTDTVLSALGAVEAMFGNTTKLRYWASDVWEIVGYKLDKGVPWMVAAGSNGAWAFAMKDAELTTMDISGVTAILDFNQALAEPMLLGVAGSEDDTVTLTYYLAVGPTDSNSAVRNLFDYLPEPLEGLTYETVEIEGTVTDSGGGDPVSGALVELQAANNEGWGVLDSFNTDDQGKFGGVISVLADGTALQLVAKYEGRPDSQPLAVDAGTQTYGINMDPGGYLSVNIKDDSGANIPAKILLYQDGVTVRRLFPVAGTGEYLVEPGDYEVSVTRGYEYTTYVGMLAIDPSATTNLDIALEHAVDTSGYLSVDAHIHAQPSPDNYISIPDRIATVAAEGLEVVVSTDHEFVNDWSWGVDEIGAGNYVATVVGQEVTASLPEHTNMYPVVPDYTVNARGGFIPWYTMTMPEIFAAERARGAEITALNHPRNGNYMSLVRYNRITGQPDLEDPTMLGYPSDAELWGWDFNTIEIMNDPEYIFINPDDVDEDGLFDDWMSFQNLGHRITAIGVSDAHNYAIPGRPRTYFVSSTDEPSEFVEQDLVTAMKEGKVVVSAGAFAKVTVNGSASVGEMVTDTDGEISLSVHIEAIPEIDVQYFKVYVNCDQVLNIAVDDPDAVVKYDGTINLTVEDDAHIAVLGFGENEMPVGLGNYDPYGTPRFIANVIFVDADGNGVFDYPGGKTCTYDLDAPE
jgi:hypothetical protein